MKFLLHHHPAGKTIPLIYSASINQLTFIAPAPVILNLNFRFDNAASPVDRADIAANDSIIIPGCRAGRAASNGIAAARWYLIGRMLGL